MKFGGRQPTGTPSLALSTLVIVASLLAGASVVHNIYKPDLFLEFVDFDLYNRHCLRWIRIKTKNTNTPCQTKKD
ncbi:hypothetical protein MKX01_003471 [Papaver californicum]|nr:hypothetical protein MKX01_003471 [Papaver californicum]